MIVSVVEAHIAGRHGVALWNCVYEPEKKPCERYTDQHHKGEPCVARREPQRSRHEPRSAEESYEEPARSSPSLKLNGCQLQEPFVVTFGLRRDNPGEIFRRATLHDLD